MLDHNLLGKPVLIRTIGEILVGRLVKVSPQGLELEDASWVSEMGRVSNTLLHGLVRPNLAENDATPDWECLPDPISVNRGVISYWTAWRHSLPKDQT